MKRLCALLCLCAANAFAAPETFVIDPTHTFAYFTYDHLGFSTQTHRFSRTAGRITLDGEARTAAVEVTIDAKSVETGSAVFNEHIQGEDFFDTARHRELAFRSTAVRFEGEQPVAVDGLLTVKGITRPVTLTITHYRRAVHPIRRKPAIGANAVATVKRSEFNMGKYAPGVSDEVKLSVALEAVQE
jgi:polyisoprenoid-binding protein YceI